MRHLSALILTFFYTASILFRAGGTESASVQDHRLYLPLVIGGSGQPAEPFLWPENPFGIATESFTPEGGINEIAGAGATWVRGPLVKWSDVEPLEGTRFWWLLDDLETQLVNAANLGLTPIVVVTGTPQWAQAVSGVSCGPVKADKLDAFADFMADLAARLSVPPYNAQVWELWETPDVDRNTTAEVNGCWGDPDDPYYGGGDYAAMLAAVYPRVKAANYKAQIIVGSLLLDCDPDNPPAGRDCRAGRFLEGILQAGGGAHFDGVAFQAADGFAMLDYYWGTAYQYATPAWFSNWLDSGPLVTAKVAFISNVLSHYGVTDKHLLNTHTAILCYSCQTFPPFFTAKEDYIPQAYAAAIAADLDASVWSSLFGEQNSGLVHPDLTPQAAYAVYQFAVDRLAGATFVAAIQPQEVGGLEGVRGYRFEREGTEVWVVWYASTTEGSNTASLNTLPDAAWDTYGNPLTPSTALTIGQSPIYVEWNWKK